MLKLLDQVIQTVLSNGWALPPKPLFSFSVPDGDWVKRVKADLANRRVNIYLYEVRENRDFRRASWDDVALAGGGFVPSMPPAYFDCHYLVSAWSPADDTELVHPVPDEHETLAEALRIILSNPDVNPTALGVIGGGPVFQEAHIYISVAPPEAPRVLNDFWSTMKLPWRPAIQLIATAPVDVLRDDTPVPPLQTLIQHYALRGAADPLLLPAATTFDESITIGGLVVRAAGGAPVAGATVRHVESGQEARTDALGRYLLAGLARGLNQLHVSAAGLTAVDRTLDVPNESPNDHVFALA